MTDIGNKKKNQKDLNDYGKTNHKDKMITEKKLTAKKQQQKSRSRGKNIDKIRMMMINNHHYNDKP